jgi:isoleucyl-tRNA synthetase
MAAALAVVSLGRAARTKASLKVRQPLARMVVSANSPERLAALRDPDLQEEIRDELNVKELVVAEKRAGYAEVTLKPNLPVLGPRLGKDLGRVRESLKAAGPEVAAALEGGSSVELPLGAGPVRLSPEDVLVECAGKPGWAVAAERGFFVALDATLSEDLIVEGLARETLNRLQNARKDLGLAVSDRVRVRVHAAGRLRTALTRHEAMLKSEALISTLDLLEAPAPGSAATEVDGEPLHLLIEKAS